ncbi:MAG TPA: hypothetical protein VFB94_07470 [Acidimicrobiales bacterium]|nr:hypothetical protein [Acidimicrobiales bacterium]
MKALGVIALAGLTALGIVGLAELTQNRPDPTVEDSTTIVSFDVATRDYRGGEETAAQALWAVCSATVDGEVTAPAFTGEDFRVTISPAIGDNGRKRLVGCLEDGTLDRVMGHVARVSTT